jgi:hypothetical protein
MICKLSINRATNPNPVYSHSYTWQYYLRFSGWKKSQENNQPDTTERATVAVIPFGSKLDQNIDNADRGIPVFSSVSLHNYRESTSIKPLTPPSKSFSVHHSCEKQVVRISASFLYFYHGTIKMDAVFSSEMSVNFYQITWRHVPDNGFLHAYAGFTQAGRMQS